MDFNTITALLIVDGSLRYHLKKIDRVASDLCTYICRFCTEYIDTAKHIARYRHRHMGKVNKPAELKPPTRS